MRFKDSIETLLKTILEHTLNERITWTSRGKQDVEAELEGTKFTFTVTWKLELNSGWTMSNGWITIKSQDFDFTVYNHDFPEIMCQLRDHFYKSHFYLYQPSEEEVVEKVANINKKISITEYRDKKIEKIFN